MIRNHTLARIAATALIGAAFAAPAFAADRGPTLVGEGENLSVVYPAPSANVVGGAIYAPSDASGQGESLRAMAATATQAGRTAIVVGSGENLTVIHLDDATPAQVAALQSHG